MSLTRFSNLAVALSVAATLLAVSAAPAAAGPRLVKRHRLRGGVVYKVYRQQRPALRIRVLKLDLQARSRLQVALGRETLPGFETTSSMARRKKAIAGINGDFALTSGRPAMAFARNAQLEQSFVLPEGSSFAVNTSETRTFIGQPQLQVEAVAGDQEPRKIYRLNNGAPEKWELALYTPVAGSLERTPKRACSARLSRVQGARVVPGEVSTVYSVDARRCRRERMKRLGKTVIASPRDGARAAWVGGLQRGQRVTINWSLGWPRVAQVVGGHPTLVARGNVVVGTSSDSFYGRHPRTGVGRTADGSVLMVTVDGRQPGYSVGMTLRGFARLFKAMGATWALNLDGGGSSTTVVGGRVVNRPSDGRERAVSSALLVVPGGTAGTRTAWSLPAGPDSGSYQWDADPPSTAGETSWDAGVVDPASIGGLSSALESAGNILPPQMQEAAHTFSLGWSPGRSEAVPAAAAAQVFAGSGR